MLYQVHWSHDDRVLVVVTSQGQVCVYSIDERAMVLEFSAKNVRQVQNGEEHQIEFGTSNLDCFVDLQKKIVCFGIGRRMWLC